jgi:hypothetical protein
MNSKEAITPPTIPLPAKADVQQDVKSLWERWDKAQSEDTSSDLVRGFNLVGIVMIIVGTLFQIMGSGFLKFRIAPFIILVGAVILAVKKFRALWSQRSLNS